MRWGVLASVLAFLLVTAVLGVMFAWFARDMETPVLNISMAVPYSAVPIGTLLAAIHLVLIARAYAAGEHEIAEMKAFLEENADNIPLRGTGAHGDNE